MTADNDAPAATGASQEVSGENSTPDNTGWAASDKNIVWIGRILAQLRLPLTEVIAALRVATKGADDPQGEFKCGLDAWRLASPDVELDQTPSVIEALGESVKQTVMPEAVDVTTLAGRPPRPYIIEGLWPLRSVLAIVAEEGFGKTVLAEQLCRQAVRGDRVLDFFDLGEAAPKRVLFIDTEMEEEDALDRDADARNRGLEVKPGQLFWYSAGGLDLDDERDLEVVSRELRRVQPHLLWIDSGINAVSEPEEGVPVQQFFNNVSRLMRQFDLLGVGLTLHARKRAQGSTKRRFDDLFGSREWKGRLNTALYMEGTRITAWKNRGGRLGSIWRQEPGKRPYAVLNTPGLSDATAVPFTVSLPEEGAGPEADAREALEAKVREVLAQRPDELTKTALAATVGGRKADALVAIDHLQSNGAVVPNAPKAKLRLAERSGSKWSTAIQ